MSFPSCYEVGYHFTVPFLCLNPMVSFSFFCHQFFFKIVVDVLVGLYCRISVYVFGRWVWADAFDWFFSVVL